MRWKNSRFTEVNVFGDGRGTGPLGVMRKRRGIGSAVIGLSLGLLLGSFLLNYRIVRSSSSDLRNNGDKPSQDGAIIGPEPPKDERSKSLLFVGVMTADKYLGSRAKAVYETWGKDLPGEIAFFSSEFSKLPENCRELPLVALPRVDDGYPPQKKSFLMLQHMWNNYGNRYEWFLRADDDVYVRTDKLEKLLRSIDSRRAMYIGQAGRGNSQEFGLLSLEYDENFCMGGPGVIMSRETLKRIVPHIKYCLKNLYTMHEDVELGRCVQKYAGIPCTWSYEMQSILYHNSSGDEAFTGNLKRKEVHRAITLHPVKSPPHMYRLHNYIRGLKIEDLQQERVRLYRDTSASVAEPGTSVLDEKKARATEDAGFVSNISKLENDSGEPRLLGVGAGIDSFKPRNSREVIAWDFYSRSEYSLADSNPRRRIHSDAKEGLDDITRQVMASINSCSRQRGRIVEERSALYGYRRVNAYGADTILDLLLVYRKYRGRKVTLPVRRHVYLHQHFTGFEIREVIDGLKETNESEHSETIKFIVPLAGRYPIFERFMKNYEETCLRTKQRTELTIVLYPRNNDDSFVRTLRLVEKMRKKYRVEGINVLEGVGNFSRGRALELAIERFNDDDLLFFVDVDILFAASALDRIRSNTLINRRIYFPVVYSQFDPKIIGAGDPGEVDYAIDEKSGYWRRFGFGIVSIYKADYRKIGGFDLTIDGWGKEDVDLYEKALRSNIRVFRSPEPNFIHVYHRVECDEKLGGGQLAMCRGTRADTYASTETLAKIIYQNPEYLKFAKIRNSGLAVPPQ